MNYTSQLIVKWQAGPPPAARLRRQPHFVLIGLGDTTWNGRHESRSAVYVAPIMQCLEHSCAAYAEADGVEGPVPVAVQ